MNSTRQYLTNHLVFIALVAVLGVIGGCMPALQRAAWDGNISVVRNYLDKGTDVNDRTFEGMTPLMYATLGRHIEIVKLLIDRGADVNAKDQNDWTALMFAAEHGQTEIAKLLIDKGADINAKNDRGNTALMHAAEKGHTEIVKLLIDRGADVNAKANNGQTALWDAARNGYTEIAKLLIDRGADVNAKDDDGCTAWMLALHSDHTEIAKLLINKGANVPSGVAVLICSRYVSLDELDGRNPPPAYYTTSKGEILIDMAELSPGVHSLKISYYAEYETYYERGEPISLVINADSGGIYVVEYKVLEKATGEEKRRWTAWIEKYK